MTRYDWMVITATGAFLAGVAVVASGPSGGFIGFLKNPATAAWVQGVGSVLAIVAAILIERGAVRRAQAQERARQVERAIAEATKIVTWERSLENAAKILEAVAASVDKKALSGRINPSRLVRMLANMARTLDLYLAQDPPTPEIAYALVAARTEFDAPLSVLRDFALNPGDVVLAMEVEISTTEAASHARQVADEYRIVLARIAMEHTRHPSSLDA